MGSELGSKSNKCMVLSKERRRNLTSGISKKRTKALRFFQHPVSREYREQMSPEVVALLILVC